jgi:DNA-binding response OmpR family regulator
MSQTKKEKERAGTILIVDDEPTIREVLWSLLTEEGYLLDSAENGYDGYEKARTLIPDLILLDVTMPVMDGFEACRKIRTEPPLAQVPIIMITALADAGSRRRSIESGANDFISKPFDLDELLAKVKNITKDNSFRERLPGRESLAFVHEELRDTCDVPIEGRASAPELRGSENKGDSCRDTGFRSMAARASEETLRNQPGTGERSPRFWRKS